MIRQYFTQNHLLRGLKGVLLYLVVLAIDYFFIKEYFVNFGWSVIILGGTLIFFVFWGAPFVQLKAAPEGPELEKEKKTAKMIVNILFLIIIFLIFLLFRL